MTLKVDTASLATLLHSNATPQAELVARQNKAASASQATPWTVPELKQDFQLERALDHTFQRVEGFMNKMLKPDGMQVAVAKPDSAQIKSETPNNAQPNRKSVGLTQHSTDLIGQVKDAGDGRVLKTYRGLDMLRLYAHNVRPKGIVVDGAL